VAFYSLYLRDTAIPNERLMYINIIEIKREILEKWKEEIKYDIIWEK